MKNILIVDDDRSFIESLKAGLEPYSNKFNIYTAFDGKEALKILRSVPVDLVVTDLKMPNLDGFELLAILSREFPTVSAIAMSAYGTPEIRAEIESLGTLNLIDKPLDIPSLVNAIEEGLKAQGNQGVLKGISLPGFLELIEMEGKTCLLEIAIKENNEKGFFLFKKGALYDALYGELKGEEAALKMIAFEDVEIRVRDIPEKKIKRRIKGKKLMNLIMEAMRIRDEKNAVDSDEESCIEEIEPLDEEEQIPINDEPIFEQADLARELGNPQGTLPDNQNAKQTDKQIHEAKRDNEGSTKLRKTQEYLKQNLEGFISCDVVEIKTGISTASAYAEYISDTSFSHAMYTDTVRSAAEAFEVAGWGTPHEVLILGNPNTMVLILLKEGRYFQSIAVASTTPIGMVKAIFNKVKVEIEQALP